MINILYHWRKHQQLVKFYSELQLKDRLCFDIGANTGKRTKALLAAGAYVIAFESHPECIETLNQKFNNNPRAKIIPCAISDNDEEKNFFLCAEYTECSTLSSEFINIYGRHSNLTYKQNIQVNCISLKTAFEKYGMPYYIKIDTEGHDLHILQNLITKIPIISFEYNRLMKQQAIEIIDALSKIYTFEIRTIHYENYNFNEPTSVSSSGFLHHFENHFPDKILTGEIFLFATGLI